MANSGHGEVIPEQRKTRILEMLAERGSITIRELQDEFRVSHMTVHRDLDALARAGEIRKVRGGAVLRAGPVGEGRGRLRACDLCGMRVPGRTEVIISRRDGSQQTGCCAHCGLLLLGDGSDVVSALGRDFLYGRMTSLFEASFLVDSAVRPCCMPSTLCFATGQEAWRFRKGFGGQVFTLREAQARLALKTMP